MLQRSRKCLAFGWYTRSLLFILAVLSNGELQQEMERMQGNDNRMNPAYLNPDLYREGIASLVNAKERAEELMYKNDIIAQLVTEMPYHEIQNRLLISGNHKEVNRSFFENLNLKDARSGNCGRFDVYRLLDMVQKSRERAMLETTTSNCCVESDGDSIASEVKNIPINELTVATPLNSATCSEPEQPFDWFRLAEASKQLLEQKAIAANHGGQLSTSLPVFQDSSQPLPTLLKIPLLKGQPLNDVVSSVLLRRLGETLNVPSQNELPLDMKSRVSTEPLLSRTNLQPPHPKTNDIKNLQIAQALQDFNKDENRSFFENLAGKKKQWNCGKGFDIYKLLDVVQRSRERAENLTLYYSLSTTASTLPKITVSSQKVEWKTESLNNQEVAIPMVVERPGGYQMPSVQVPPAEAYSPVPQVNFPFEQMQMQIKPTTMLYRQFHSLVKFPIRKLPPVPNEEAPISSAALSQESNNLLLQPKENKPPMLIPILEKSYFPRPVNFLPKAIDPRTSRIGVRESNDDPGLENGYQDFKNFLGQKSRS